MKKRLAFCLAAVFLLSGGSTERVKEAEDLMRNVSREMIAVFEDKTRSRMEKEEAIRAYLKENVALYPLARFLLGRHARQVDKAQMKIYTDLLEEYALTVYVRRLLFYDPGDRQIDLKIVQSRKKGTRGREAIVSTDLEGVLDEALRLDWWLLLDKKGRWRIFNIGVGGLWMAQEQRAAFAALIRNNGGEVSVLLDHLRERIKEAKDAPPPDAETQREN